MSAHATYALYIGADNKTGQIDLDRIARIVSSRHEGFTLVEAKGYWRGKAEPSAIVTIDGDYKAIMQTVGELGYILDQDAIGVQPVAAIEFVSDYPR